MAIGFFSAASIIASKVANGTAADHTYLYSRFSNIEIKTGFVNGQTVFAVCSFPYVHCNGSSGVHIQIAGEVRNAGFELLHLNEEQQAKWGFEWGITAEQMRAFTNYAPSHCISEIEVNGKTHGIPLFDKTALNQIKTLNAFVQYVAKWESLNHDAFEALESADEQDCEATEPAPETETTDVQDCISGPTESSGSALAPAGATALALPATAPIFVPETAIIANKSAPCVCRFVTGLSSTESPEPDTTEEPEVLEATPVTDTGNGPLAPLCCGTECVSFDYYGHHYDLKYSNKGWLWSFDDYKDPLGRGFTFRSQEWTLAELADIGFIETDARFFGELVSYVENSLHINLGAFKCKGILLNVSTENYNLGKNLDEQDLLVYQFFGVKVNIPVRKQADRLFLGRSFELAEWRIDVAGYGAKLLCDAGFSESNAVDFIKGWIWAILGRAENELERRRRELDEEELGDIPF